MGERSDIVVVGAGAAGLMAAIEAARVAAAGAGARVVVLDGAAKLGAKILIAGGGRCNVTNEVVRPEDFNGSSRHSIRKVLGRLDVQHTRAFFEEIGVKLKSEAGGKLFPTTDRAATVLEALLAAATDAGVELACSRRVDRIEQRTASLVVSGEWGEIEAARVILACGGRSLPRTGSDGGGYDLARALGHSTTDRIFPALVPLLLPEGHALRGLSGVSKQVRLEVRAAAGHRMATATGSLLCTHFGVSGPVVLDISRHWLDASADAADAGHAGDVSLVCDWVPTIESESLDEQLREPGSGSVAGRLKGRLPVRLMEALCAQAGVGADAAAAELPRASRRAIITALEEDRLPVCGQRGWNFAEVTAGGVPLAELDVKTMESRVCPGLYICGEICDVDGRIGGFNFQWAWASGFVAGHSATRSLREIEDGHATAGGTGV